MIPSFRLLRRLAVCAGLVLATTLLVAPAASAGSYADTCRGWGGVANNVVSGAVGGLRAPVTGEARLGTPYLDGDVVRVDSSVSFYSWGSCSAQVAFQMQTKACGAWGCHWQTRNNGKWEFLWAHDDTGEVAQQVTMGCREGTNSYRVHMAVIGVKSVAEREAIGIETENDSEDGPVVKLSCPER